MKAIKHIIYYCAALCLLPIVAILMTSCAKVQEETIETRIGADLVYAG